MATIIPVFNNGEIIAYANLDHVKFIDFGYSNDPEPEDAPNNWQPAKDKKKICFNFGNDSLEAEFKTEDEAAIYLGIVLAEFKTPITQEEFLKLQ